MDQDKLNRRAAMRRMTQAGITAAVTTYYPAIGWGAARNPDWDKAVTRGLQALSRRQSSLGNWVYPSYGSTPATALAGTALICSGSTTTQGPYARYIRRATDYLMTKVRSNGLIGDPRDSRYTYGHGFSMLFLSQVLGEEEDAERREELVQVLSTAVRFSGQAQATSGGWGYVSAKDVPNFDEGSTTITQVQGLRGCRNAGIPVPGEVIENAKKYIYSCKNPDGGISYSSRRRGSSRPAITAAALAALYNAGDYDSKQVPDMLNYCQKNLDRIGNETQSFGHWHYTYLYYSQVVYRQGEKLWQDFRDRLYRKLVAEQLDSGLWQGSSIGPDYTSSCNLIMLQLDNAYLPIYQR